MQINTGQLIKQLRRTTYPRWAGRVWGAAANHWSTTTTLASQALSLATALPKALAPALTGLNRFGRVALGDDVVPLWSPELPTGGRSRRRERPVHQPVAVYLPACVNAMFGSDQGVGVQRSFEALVARAGLTLLVPETIDALCCGTPWSSKGQPAGQAVMRQRLWSVLDQASDHGRLPVVCDASSCTEGIQQVVAAAGAAIEVIDAVDFVARHVLPTLGDYPKLASITLHQTCSATLLGLGSSLMTVAAAVAEQVNLPLNNGCCAFAGDRGLLHPELTAAATGPEAAEVAVLDAVAHASCNRTCELGLTRATGRVYRHLLEWLAEQVEKG
jgi:D-lactate dehydrogenase